MLTFSSEFLKISMKSFSFYNVDKENVRIFYCNYLQLSLLRPFFSQVALSASQAFGESHFFNVEDDQKALLGRSIHTLQRMAAYILFIDMS